MRNDIVRLAYIYVAGLPDHRALRKGPAIEIMSGLQSNRDAGQFLVEQQKASWVQSVTNFPGEMASAIVLVAEFKITRATFGSKQTAKPSIATSIEQILRSGLNSHQLHDAP
jgi:ABC-type uncharacterized transport system permease subunit